MFPTRTLRDRPDLTQLKRQAKELRRAFVSGEAEAVAEVSAFFHGADPNEFALNEAQLVLARSHGFASWPRLKAYVDGVTVKRLVDAVIAGDVAGVRNMLAVRPELVSIDMSENDEHQALHHAVLQRRPEMVRLLMEHGADAHKGIYPHRDATSPLTLAEERGFTDIVSIIKDAEAGRANARQVVDSSSLPSTFMEAFRRSDETAMIAEFESNPALVRAVARRSGSTPLHWAAANLWVRLGTWLIEHGADPLARAAKGETPLDVVASDENAGGSDRQRAIDAFSRLLLTHGADRSVRSAIASGDGEYLRRRHAEGALRNETGLVSYAVKTNRAETLALLLELGMDPDERERVAGLEETIESFGEPLRACAISGSHDLAKILLEHGANPNTDVYAASSAISEAYSHGDQQMVELLKHYGGSVGAVTAGFLGLMDEAKRLLDAEAADAAAPDVVSGFSRTRSIADTLLESAADGGHVELVRLALGRLAWPKDDSRWAGMLRRPFGHHSDADRLRFLECFRLLVERGGANPVGGSGRTPLHEVAAAWPYTPLTPRDRVAFATILIDAGARLNARDGLLRSTPLGWACRWGRVELVKLLLERGADPLEAESEAWARPRAWAEKKGHADVLALLS